MNKTFRYDYISDYQEVKFWAKYSHLICGLSLIIFSILQFLKFNNSNNYLVLTIGVITFLGGFLILIFSLNRFKPLIIKGDHYLLIDDNKISIKLGKYRKLNEIYKDEIKQIRLENNKVVLTLTNRKDVWINTLKIQNNDKRQEFVALIKSFEMTKSF